MGETCKSCAKWEEEIYWNHFQLSSFIQLLYGDFHHKLAIPIKFANNLRKELPDSVELKGPSGAIWSVGLKHSDGTIFFEHGWPKFVRDHSLQENDILAFTYNRDSCFNVLMFERRSLCEKETSYFVRNCENPRCECRCSPKRKAKENPLQSSQNSSHELNRCTSSNDDDGSTLLRRHHVVSPKFQRKPRTKSVQSNKGLRNRGPASASASAGEVMIKSGSEFSRGVNSRLLYVSNRRPVTEAEKRNAIELAQVAATDESFIVVLRPTQVYKGFYLVIPRKWLHRHLNPKIQWVTLRVGDSRWDVKCYYNENHNIGRLTSGWKNFAVENNLEESDVCVFKAGSVGGNSIIVDVSIFRVVEETVPPRRVVSGSSSKRGRAAKRARKQVLEVSDTNI